LKGEGGVDDEKTGMRSSQPPQAYRWDHRGMGKEWLASLTIYTALLSYAAQKSTTICSSKGKSKHTLSLLLLLSPRTSALVEEFRYAYENIKIA
jgi:hypothetical protein